MYENSIFKRDACIEVYVTNRELDESNSGVN
jgi:hypothetical protein